MRAGRTGKTSPDTLAAPARMMEPARKVWSNMPNFICQNA
jgi:hypothetical protein